MESPSPTPRSTFRNRTRHPKAAQEGAKRRSVGFVPSAGTDPSAAGSGVPRSPDASQPDDLTNAARYGLNIRSLRQFALNQVNLMR